jgi:hypothetical protein
MKRKTSRTKYLPVSFPNLNLALILLIFTESTLPILVTYDVHFLAKVITHAPAIPKLIAMASYR